MRTVPKPKHFTATRHVSYTSAVDGNETYCLIFTHTQGDPHIHIKFRDGWPHDSINVYDHAKDVSTIETWDDFRQAVTYYMEHQVSRDSLRLDWVNAS